MRKKAAVIAVVCLCASASAQTIEIGRSGRSAASPHGVAAIGFDLDPAANLEEASEISFRLPGRESPARLDRGEFRSRGGRNGLWRGKADGRDDSEVMLTFHEGHVAGTIRVGTDLYEVRPTAEGQVVEKLDPASFAPCAGPPAETPVAAAVADGSGASAPAAQQEAAALNAAGTYTIDLLSVYTPQARATAGGATQMAALIQSAVDSANQAFVNSGVGITYRLAGTAEAAHNDAGDMNADLSWLVADPATATLRNQLGADMVSLVVENGAGYCGLGYVMRSPGAGFAGYAMQVTARSCAVGNLSFAHEHGHNLGMEHDPANGVAPGSASYPFSFGHLVNGVFRTVMSYASACTSGCTRMPYFSNPNVTYLGYPTGVVNVADNAQTANLTASIVAAFKSPPPAGLPAAPAGLTATATSTSQIVLAWTDNSSDESGFRIERSVSGGSFVDIGSVGAAVTSFNSNGLAAGTSYSYRVRAYNANGYSGYTNTATATTQLSPPPSAPAALSATAVSASQINLAWTDASSNESGFRIERSSGGSSFVEIATVGAGVTSYASSGLVANTAYSYRVRAYNAGGNSDYTNTATATTPLAPAPSAPTGLSATAVSASQINLAWTDASSDESGFRIERSSGGSAFVEIGTVGAGVTSYSSSGLTASTAYSYRVRAYNGGGNSDYSAAASATTQAAATLPVPANFSGSAVFTAGGRTLSSIRLSWTDGVGETGYRIEKCQAATLTTACTYGLYRTMGANAKATTDNTVSVTGRGIYKYRIRAESANGDSAWAETTVDAR